MGKFFRFKSIRTKIILGFGIVTVLVIAMAILTQLGFKRVNETSEDIVMHQSPILSANDQLTLNVSEISSLVRAYIIEDNPEIKEEIDEVLEEGEIIKESLMEMSNDENAFALLEKKDDWEKSVLGIVATVDAGEQEKAVTMVQDLKPVSNEIMSQFADLAENRRDKISTNGEKMVRTGELTGTFILVIAISVAIIGALIGWFMSRSISRPLTAVMNRMNSVAKGDLSQPPLETDARDEIAQLVTATNTMSENNRKLLNRISEVTEIVSSQSEELTQSAEEVRGGTEQIASTMQEIATGAETQANSATELTNAMVTFSNLVENANKAGEEAQGHSTQVLSMTTDGSELMSNSTKQMLKINDIVKDSVEKMKSLDHQSQEISKLISVIEGIADQTNLLALNAAIEAARAGEHGAGFAVVADEVRKLAEQVSVSVQDITGIVSSIQTESNVVASALEEGFTEVEQGTVQIESTEKTFKEIHDAVSHMATGINSVSDNLNGILENSEHMSASISDVAAVSEETAAGVEETAASAQQSNSSMEEMEGNSTQLSKLAEELNELVGQFKLS